jgi:hypothetical protein
MSNVFFRPELKMERIESELAMSKGWHAIDFCPSRSSTREIGMEAKVVLPALVDGVFESFLCSNVIVWSV